VVFTWIRDFQPKKNPGEERRRLFPISRHGCLFICPLAFFLIFLNELIGASDQTMFCARIAQIFSPPFTPISFGADLSLSVCFFPRRIVTLSMLLS
jgi:hypothetical protein